MAKEQRPVEEQEQDKHEVHVTVEGLKGTIVQPMELGVIEQEAQPAYVKLPNGDVFPIFETRAARRDLMHRVQTAIKKGKPVKRKKLPKGIKVKKAIMMSAEQQEQYDNGQEVS